ncbi:MAG: hypothetical protein LBJ47_11125, partial [Tannerella sp.]|nr:hypothetical protein [Tannerella sp.]
MAAIKSRIVNLPVRTFISIEKTIHLRIGLSRKPYPVVLARRNDEAIRVTPVPGLLRSARKGCLESHTPSSLRGGTTKQSGLRLCLDCFVVPPR